MTAESDGSWASEVWQCRADHDELTLKCPKISRVKLYIPPVVLLYSSDLKTIQSSNDCSMLLHTVS